MFKKKLHIGFLMFLTCVILLASFIASWASEPEAGLFLPEIAESISGKKYILEDNPFNLRSFTLTFQEEKEEARLSFSAGEICYDLLPLGLDNVYRITNLAPEELDSPLGLKGLWEDDNTFLLYCHVLDSPFAWDVKFDTTFEADRVSIQIEDIAEGIIATIYGQLQE